MRQLLRLEPADLIGFIFFRDPTSFAADLARLEAEYREALPELRRRVEDAQTDVQFAEAAVKTLGVWRRELQGSRARVR